MIETTEYARLSNEGNQEGCMKVKDFVKLSMDEQAEYLLANNLLTPREAYALGQTIGGAFVAKKIKNELEVKK